MTNTLTKQPVTTESQSYRQSATARILAVGVIVSAISVVIAIGGLALDDRQITGADAWLKPLKFAISLTVFLATIRWVLSLVDGHRRRLAWISGVVVMALVLEIVGINVQVLRGTTSHFNEATLFDAAVYFSMGGLIILVVLATIAAAALSLRNRAVDAGVATGIRWGMALSIIGMLAAVFMIMNTEWNSTGGHTVGAVDGGPGMLLTGWSTEHGDLRIPHFVGLHGLQVVPFVAWALARWSPLGSRARVHIVVMAGAAYAGLIALVLSQALRGQPLLRPDGITLGLAAALVVLFAIGTAITVVRDRR